MKKNRGFTLIEIIVVIALLGILMALTVPGLMNYFGDVEMDKARSEAKSVLVVAQGYHDELSLAGNDNSASETEITDNFIKESIVKKAQGTGKINKLYFKNGEITKFRYVVSGYEVELSITGNLLIMNTDDEFYQKDY